jgi:hypothetical protein
MKYDDDQRRGWREPDDQKAEESKQNGDSEEEMMNRLKYVDGRAEHELTEEDERLYDPE